MVRLSYQGCSYPCLSSVRTTEKNEAALTQVGAAVPILAQDIFLDYYSSSFLFCSYLHSLLEHVIFFGFSTNAELHFGQATTRFVFFVPATCSMSGLSHVAKSQSG